MSRFRRVSADLSRALALQSAQPAMRLPPIPEFFAPLPLAAVVVMALNDHVWKAQYHNAWTGKLSDIAGCFFLPLFLSGVLALVTRWSPLLRLYVGGVATALFFFALKSSQSTADAVCGAMDVVGRLVATSCGRILADPTDLIAVPFTAVAVLYGARRAGPRADTRHQPGVSS